MTELELKQQAAIKELVEALKEYKTVMYNLTMNLEQRPLYSIFGDIDLIINKHS